MTISSLAHGAILVTLPWLALEFFAQHWWKSTQRWLARKGVWKARRDGRMALHALQEGIPTFSRGMLWLRLETVSFNRLPARLVGRFATKAARRRDRGCRFYDFGIVIGITALLVSVAVIVFGAYEVIGQIVDLSSTEGGGGEGQLTKVVKRSLQPDTSTATKSSDSLFAVHLVPLIPGLTLPWSHLVPLVIALAATQLVHEAGHAICAALYNLEPEKMGVILLYPFIPGAFVVLPRQASHTDDANDHVIDEESAQQETYERSRYDTSQKYRMKLQIIAAGIWHNAVTFFVLALLLSSPVRTAGGRIFWRDASCMRVLEIEPSSPLSSHIPAGVCITAVDDVSLVGPLLNAEERAQIWAAYLSYDKSVALSTTTDDKGWCFQEAAFQSARNDCCQRLDSAPSSQSETGSSQAEGVCFSSIETRNQQKRCLDPFTTLIKTKVRCGAHPCPLNADGESQTCVIPDEREQLLRLATSPASSENDHVVLFQGNRNVVLHTVAVTPFAFRLDRAGWLEYLVQTYALIVRYTFTLSLAMAIFNMLPLPGLDGDVFLLVLLQSLSRGQVKPLPTTSSAQRHFNGLQLSLARHQSLLVEMHARMRWIVMALTIFVVGGSVLVHTIQI